MTDLDEIRRRIAAHGHWYHQIEVAPGILTPGDHASARALAHLDGLGLPADCSGLRVLDIGCRDGFFSFALERRGATVLGMDYALPTSTGFSLASELVGSQVEYLVENVYDLSPEKHGQFDLVLFLGVLYHLRHPLLAIDRIRDVCRPGARVFVETQLLDEHFVLANGKAVRLSRVSHELSNVPLLEFFPRRTLNNDPTSKWAPNLACLRRLLEEALFEVTADRVEGARGYAAARAVADDELESMKRLDSSRGVHLP